MAHSLSILPYPLAVARLAPDDLIPQWVNWSDPFIAVTRTDDEISIVCKEERVPDAVRAERDWRAFRVDGPLDFNLTGILSSLAAPLAAAGLSIFALSTYDTDYVLVRGGDLDEAIRTLSVNFRIT
jgi:uncharacterized protein